MIIIRLTFICLIMLVIIIAVVKQLRSHLPITLQNNLIFSCTNADHDHKHDHDPGEIKKYSGSQLCNWVFNETTAIGY